MWFYFPGKDREFSWRDGVALVLFVGTCLPPAMKAEMGDSFPLGLPEVVAISVTCGCLAGLVWGDWHVVARMATGAIGGLCLSLGFYFLCLGHKPSKFEMAMVLALAALPSFGLGYLIHHLLYVPGEDPPEEPVLPTANIDPDNPPPKLSWDFLKKPDEPGKSS